MIPFRIEKREGAPFAVTLYGADLIAGYVQQAKAAAAAVSQITESLDEVLAVAADLPAIDTAAANIAAIQAVNNALAGLTALLSVIVDANIPGVAQASTSGEYTASDVTSTGVNRMALLEVLASAKIATALVRKAVLINPLGFREEEREASRHRSGVAEAVYAADGETELRRTNADGSYFFALIETLSAKIGKLVTSEAGTRTLRLNDLTGTRATTEVVPGTFLETLVDDAEHTLWGLNANGEAFLQQPTRALAERRRTDADTNYRVWSKRRSTSGKCDLFVERLLTGERRQITSDVSDTYDFCDPRILGDKLMLSRRSGDSATTLGIRLLVNGALQPNLNAFLAEKPTKNIASYGDSFRADGGNIARIANALVGKQVFTELGFVAGNERGMGSRSLTGSTYAFTGGTTGPNDVPANKTYAGNPQDRASILGMTDDGNPNDGITTTPARLAQFGRFFAAQDTLFADGFILQPGLPLGGVGGSASRAQWEQREADTAAAFPAFYVPVLAWMQASAGTGYMRLATETAAATPPFPADSLARDQEYVAAGMWPASCYVNPGNGPLDIKDGHPSELKGKPLYEEAAARHLTIGSPAHGIIGRNMHL